MYQAKRKKKIGNFSLSSCTCRATFRTTEIGVIIDEWNKLKIVTKRRLDLLLSCVDLCEI